jgi:acyl transferase domain-containing protein
VVTERQPWPANGRPRRAGPRRAGVSSFGIGGTNAHAIVEEAPVREPGSPSRPVQLLMLSARTESALAQAATNLAGHLRQHPELELADAAYTLQTGRRAFDYRRVIVCSSHEEALAGLEMSDPQRVMAGVRQGLDRPVVFMFSGQGSQYPEMAAELYDTESIFQEAVDTCCDLLRPFMGLDLRPVLLGHASDAAEQLNQTRFTQPALFVTEYALAQLWQSWGIEPAAMIGHSIGEYVAACLAGVFSLQDALQLVAERGRLMQELPTGSMLAVSLSEAAVQPYLTADLSVAAVNERSRCVVSGPDAAVDALIARLEAQSVSSQRLHTSHAFHSAMMDPILDEFTALVGRLSPQAPEERFISNVSGTWITAEQATDPGYWATHLRQAVRFADGVGTLLRENSNYVFLEVGPGRTLTTLARRHSDKGQNHLMLGSLRHPQDSGSNVEFLLRSLGQLWTADVTINWSGFYAGERRCRVSLPTYPFERQRYWIDPGMPGLYGAQLTQPDSGKKADIADWFYIPSWKRSLPPAVPAPAGEGRTWVLFMDTLGVGAALAERLRQRGDVVLGVHIGERFSQDAEHCFTLNPENAADYDAFVQSLAEQELVSGNIVHLWNVGTADTPLTHNFYSLLYLTQALGRMRDAEAQVKIRVVTNQMQAVANESALHPTKAAVLGPCKVVTQEYEQITCQSIDLSWSEGDKRREGQAIELLTAELLNDSDDGIIAYRGSDRWVQSYEQAPLPPAAAALPSHLRREGVYLITGGLGGLGLEVARYLAQTVQARLVLTGRAGLPPRSEWQAAFNNGNDAARRKIEQVQALEAMGAAVLVLAADVTQSDQMEDVVAQSLSHFGALHGVFHAAGTPGAGIVQLKSQAKAAEVLAPKVAGALVLNELLQEHEVDFLCLFSSITAVTGGFGQVDYCAANAFLDALAQANMAQGGPYTISINWDAWQKVGMAVDTASLRTLPGSDDGRFEAVGHPLVEQYRRDSAEKALFRTEFSPARHWVLSEHHVVGTPTIPGATYPEIAAAAFRHHTGAEGVEINDLLFITPFMTAEDETKTMHLSLERTEDGFAFRARSRQEHVNAVIRPLAGAAPEQRDVAAIIDRCSAVDLSSVGEAGMAQFVDTGPRWDCIEAVYAGEQEGLAVLRLAEAFAGDLEQFALHPALMDIATAFAIHSIGAGNYLPLAYKRVRVYDAFTNPLYCYVRVPEQAAKAETVNIDVTIMDEQGRVLVAIDGFSVKRVSADAAQRLAEAAQQNAALAAEETDNAPTSFRNLADGILPEEGVEALARILNAPYLPQVVVSTRDLAVTIEAFNSFDPKAFLEGTAAAPRRAAEIHPRPNLPVPFVAPRTTAEQQIADLWQAVLGIDKVGVHDNFFELGGDSLLGTQIMAQAKGAGIELTPDQFFQHQTIAEIAALLDETAGDGMTAEPLPETVMKEEQMLSQLDQLSEEEMDALLAEMLVEEGD